MIVRMRTQYAGATGTVSPGEQVNLPEAEARALIAGGYAEPVEDLIPARRETATPPAAETATAITEKPESAKPAGFRRRGK
jgi:hypothetical protein